MTGFVNFTRMVYANACQKPIPASGGDFFDPFDAGRARGGQKSLFASLDFPIHDFSGKNDLQTTKHQPNSF